MSVIWVRRQVFTVTVLLTDVVQGMMSQRDRMANSRNKLAHVRCLLSPDTEDEESNVRARSRTEGANGN